MPRLNGDSWPSIGGVATIRWAFAESNLAGFAAQFEGYDLFSTPIAAQFRDTIRSAFAAWSRLAGIDFVEVADGLNAQLRLGNRDIDGPMGDILGETSTWFTGTRIEAAQICFDVDSYDEGLLFLVAEHEIGHAFGLGHTEDPLAVMYAFADPDRVGYLNVDDIVGVTTLYGSRDDFAASTSTIGLVAVGGSIRGTLETRGDTDWFMATLAAGRTYRIDVQAYDSDEGSLDDPLLRILSPEGQRLEGDDDGGPGLEARNVFSAGTSGPVYLSVTSAYEEADGLDLGSYRVVVTDITTGAGGAAALTTAGRNILRQAGATVTTDLAAKVTSGEFTFVTAVGDLIRAAGATSSVATLSYQFFTGRIPSATGMDFLVSPTGPNANNLNSAYYQSFSLENRYINFAVNLGKVGEGAAAFLTKYGGLDLFESTRLAYATIFGGTPNDAKLHAILDPSFNLNGLVLTRAEYFAFYGGDGLNGIGTKAAMVGYLLAEAVKADLGVYAKVNDAFLSDLVDGATFSVDIVGVYNKPEYVFGGA